jgi:hypothetical protein
MYILFFFVPGFIYVWFENRFRPSSKVYTVNTNTQFFLLSIGIFGFFNLVFTMSLVKVNFLCCGKLLEVIKSADITQGMTGIENFDFALFYLIMMSFTVTVQIALKIFAIDKLVLCISNRFRSKKNKAEELETSSVWDDIIETNCIGDKYKVVEINKDGVFVTRGFLNNYSPPDDMNKELGVEPHYLVEEEFEKDKERKTEAEKIFGESEQDYYDMQTGTLIKIYDTSKWMKKHATLKK